MNIYILNNFLFLFNLELRRYFFFFLEEFMMVLLNNEEITMGYIPYYKRNRFYPYISIRTKLCKSCQSMCCIIAFSSCVFEERPLELFC